MKLSMKVFLGKAFSFQQVDAVTFASCAKDMLTL